MPLPWRVRPDEVVASARENGTASIVLGARVLIAVLALLAAACGGRSSLPGLQADGGLVRGDVGAPLVDASTFPADASLTEAGMLDSDAGSPDTGCVLPSAGVVFTLATGQSSPAGIVTNGSWAYWANFEGETAGIAAAPLCGGRAVLLVPGERGADEVAIDDSSVYWVTSVAPSANAVRRVALGGGAASTITTSPSPAQLSGIAVDDAYVYYSGGQGPVSQVARVAKTGGTGAFLSTTASDGPVAVDSTSVYFGSNGAIMSVPKAGGPATTLSAPAGPTVSELTIDADTAYWVAPPQNGNRTSILSVPKAGGTPAALIATEGLNNFAIDATYIYWSTPTGLYRRTKTGGQVETVVGGLVGAQALAVAQGALVWTVYAEDGDAGVFGIMLP